MANVNITNKNEGTPVQKAALLYPQQIVYGPQVVN